MKKKLLILIFCVIAFLVKAQDIDTGQISKPKKFLWTGTIGANTSIYTSTRAFSYPNPFSYNVNANLNLRISDKVDVPIGFTIGKYQNSFTDPFLQFNIAPHYKWATLYAGNINLTFNPYTLAGFSFLGTGVELNPGKFRFMAMYGRMAPAIEIDTSGTVVTIPSFKRMGYGAKIGYGDNNNFIDLIYFRAKDDENSISSWKQPEVQQKIGDALLLTPQENKVIGLSSKATFIKNFTFTLDAGIAFINRDITDSQKVQPKGLNISDTDKLEYAGKFSVGYTFKDFFVSTDYERVTSNYTSFGSYFFNNDIENFTISPAGIIAKGRGSYNISLGLQKNNLNKTRTETTKRFIGNANVSYNPNEKWNFLLNYNNYSIRQIPTVNTISNEFLIRQVNQTFTFSPTYTLKKDTSVTHSFSFASNYNDVNDRNVLTKQYGNMKSTMLSLNHSALFTKNNRAINSGINFNNIKTFAYTNNQYGITAGYSQNFLKQKLFSSLNVNYNVSYVNFVQDGSITNGSLILNYAFKNKHNFSLNSTLINTRSKQFNDYTDFIGSISYQLYLR